MQNDHFYVGGGAAKTPEQVSFLQKKYDLFDKEILKEIFNDILKIKTTEIVRPEIVGLAHVVYFVKDDKGKEYCFRANLGNEKPEIELQIEKLTSDLARKNGVQTNRIIHVDCSRKKYKFDFQIQEKLTGENPEHDFRGNQKDYDMLSFELGQIIGKMSKIKIKGFGRFDKKIALHENRLVPTFRTNYEYILLELESQVRKIEEAKLLNSKQGKKILNVFSDSKKLLNIKEGSLVHYDLADHNFFYDPKSFNITGLMDWEAVCVSDSMLDLASAPTWKTLYERKTKLLEGYKSVSVLPKNYEEKIDLYTLRTVIWKVVHNIKFNLLNKERTERFYNALIPFGI